MPSSIQFGTQRFTAATGSRAEGIPEHAAMIKGRLIHLNEKTLTGWGITAKASDQIIASIPGVPIRACNSHDPHACDASYDDSRVGYATKAWIDGEWIMAAAAITDENAAKNIDNGTWTPFGKGGWSVVGFPAESSLEAFKKSGFMDGFRPAGISLVLAPDATPGYVGSGFEMVAAAISNYRGNTMSETPAGGTDPVTYTQEQFDAAVKTALETQKTDDAAALKKAADAEIAKQNEASIAELTKQKAAHDAAIKKLSDDDKAAYEAKIAGMTSKDDMKTILEAHGKKVQADTLETLERGKLITEYGDVVQKSPVAGAPFMQDGQFSQELFSQEITELGGMQTAAIAGIVNKAKMVAAAVPGSDFNSLEYPITPPGSNTQETKDMAALAELQGV